MKCHVVKDLLPNQIDGLNGEETSALVNEHLEGCADCRLTYEKMTAEVAPEVKAEEKNIVFLKKLRARILRKSVIVAFSTCVIVLGSLTVFAKTYEIPIPFDRYRMTVELIPNAVASNADGSSAWWDLSYLEPSDDVYFAPDTEIPKDYKYIMDVLHIAYQGFSRISGTAISRDINRDGENVRVVFYRYTKTPWTSLFFDYDLVGTHENGTMTGSQIYGESYGRADYEPQMIEIYYLRARDLSRIDRLTDEEFDAQRVNAALVWSGVI